MDQIVSRFDAGRFDALPRTTQGGVIIPAALTRTGVFTYYRGDGTKVREYRPPTEVFNADSLATLKSATVTVGHPGLVNAKNYRAVTVGHVDDEGRQDGNFVAAPVRVLDSDTLGKVERKELTELSCGYSCKLDATPGVTPEGEAYDVVQRNIVYNHVALLPKGGGRAGGDVKLRLDDAGSQIEDEPAIVAPPVADVKVDESDRGTLGVQPPPAPPSNRTDSTVELAAALAKITELETKLATAQPRLDSVDAKDAQIELLKGSVKDLQVKLDAAMAPDAVDARVNARVELVSLAHAHLDAKDAPFKADGKTDHDLRVAVLGKLAPAFKCDGKSEPAVEGALALALETTAAARDGFRKVVSATPAPAGAPVRQDGADAYVRNVQASQKAHETAPVSRISAK